MILCITYYVFMASGNYSCCNYIYHVKNECRKGKCRTESYEIRLYKIIKTEHRNLRLSFWDYDALSFLLNSFFINSLLTKQILRSIL